MPYKIFAFIVFSFIVSLCWNIERKPQTEADMNVCLSVSGHAIARIIPDTTDFSDLTFLKKVLADKKILLIGEQTHYDASTFLAKTRLIQFLHQEMGFDHILFEGGFYDMWVMNETASTEGQTINPRLGLYWFWSDCAEMEPFWKYVQEKNIRLYGFDPQYQTGNMGDSLQFILLENYLTQKGLNINRYHFFAKMKGRMFWSQFYDEHDRMYSKNTKDSILHDLDRMMTDLSDRKAATTADSIYIRYLYNMRCWLECVWKYELGNYTRFHIRDSLMADNIFWQLDCFPETKVIIWASNMHVQNAVRTDGQSFTTMGNRLKEKYKEQCYAICFTSYCRQNKLGNACMKAGRQTLEDKLHATGIRHAFWDFSSMHCTDRQAPVYAEVNQRMNTKAEWMKRMDGLFYIDTMKTIVSKTH